MFDGCFTQNGWKIVFAMAQSNSPQLRLQDINMAEAMEDYARDLLPMRGPYE